ncbi:MAG: EAL domain-containing protein [Betaproteobacteria bacterium]|nr:EAL domain-containing protein [Betaproteobacteria bacterium]
MVRQDVGGRRRILRTARRRLRREGLAPVDEGRTRRAACERDRGAGRARPVRPGRGPAAFHVEGRVSPRLPLRSLRARIAVFFILLLVVVEGIVYALVSAGGERIAEQNMAEELLVGERVVRRLVDQNARRLTDATQVLAADFGFRAAVATHDIPTIASALRNHGARIDASVVMLASLDRRLVADSRHPERTGDDRFPLPTLIDTAAANGRAAAIVLLDGRPYQMVMVPVRAPLPIAWVAMGFLMDHGTAADLQAVSGLQVSLVSRAGDGHWSVLASTLPSSMVRSLTANEPRLEDIGRSATLKLDGEPYLSLMAVLGDSPEGRVSALLQRSRREATAPFDRLSAILGGVALVSVLFSIAGSVLIARSITRPVRLLAAAARRIRDGDYDRPVIVDQRDELGELAASFNHMLGGIAERESKILRLAYEDTLTGLPNRAMFRDRLRQTLRTAARARTPFAVMVLDLDRFQYVNDSLGHPAGDEILKEVAKRLKGTLRESDTVARLGGDEFAILLPESDPERVHRAGRRIVAALEPPIVLEGQPVDVSASLGVSCYPEHDADPDMLLRNADVAMHLAKRSGGEIALYDPSGEDGRRSHLSLLTELRRAIQDDELDLHFQPKLELRTGRIVRAEALVRWMHPVRGFVPPSEFIPFAEQTGYVRHVTRWVLRTVVRTIGAWHADGLDVTVSANVSTRDLLDAELPDLIASLLETHATPPGKLCLEITESGVMEDPQRALETLRRLHALGLRLSIDDFGTGYSSLSYLKKLPVQELKIDGSFVRHMADDEDDATIVRSTIELGHNMGLEVVAEGVETEAGLDLLRSLGCDEAQGYVISRPLPAPAFVAWLRERRARPRPAEGHASRVSA